VGSVVASDIRGLAWEERDPNVLDQSSQHYQPFFQRLLAQGGDSWDDDLWSFAYGPGSRVIPLCQLLVLIDAWIQHVGGFRLADMPDSATFWS
jgi:hypothetical protein